MRRADRNFAELLQELRVAQTGVQILFAFLLTLSFSDRLAEAEAYLRVLYIATLTASALTVALLVAPVAIHRILFARGRKAMLVTLAHRCAIAGLTMLVATMTGAMLLALHMVAGPVPGLILTSAVAAFFVALWLGLPISMRGTSRRRRVPEQTRRPRRPRPREPRPEGVVAARNQPRG